MSDTPIHDNLTAEWFASELASTDDLAALIAEGLPHIEACRVVYGDGPSPTAEPAVWHAWVRNYVARKFRPLREAWGLA